YACIPGFSYFRSPAHTVFIYTFFTALLAGYGFRELDAHFKKSSMLGVALFCILLGLVVFCFGQGPPDVIAEVAKKNMLHGIAVFIGIVSLTVTIIVSGQRFPRIGAYSCALLLLVAFADLYFHYAGAATSGTWASPMYFERVPTRIARIREDAGIISTPLPGTKLNESELQNGLFRIYTRPEGILGSSPFGFNRAMLHR